MVKAYDPVTLGMVLEMTKRPLDYDSLQSDLVVESASGLHSQNQRVMVSCLDVVFEELYKQVVGHIENMTDNDDAAKPVPAARRLTKSQKRSRRPDSVILGQQEMKPFELHELMDVLEE